MVVPISLATYTAEFPNVLLREHSLSLLYHEEHQSQQKLSLAIALKEALKTLDSKIF